MTASGLILPGRSPRRQGRVANALLLWRATDLDIVPVTGQQTDFTRAGTAPATDHRNVAWTAIAHQPAWTAFASAGTGTPDRLALLLGSADNLTWPILFQPPFQGEDMTVFLEYDPTWARTGGIAGAPGLFNIGGTGTLIADTLQVLDVVRSSVSAQLTVRFSQGTVVNQFPLAIPASGPIQLLLQFRASGANHTVYGELGLSNGTTAALAVAGKQWRTMTAGLNKARGSSASNARYTRFAVARGRRTAAEMLAL
jgi:hypothetical protein